MERADLGRADVVGTPEHEAVLAIADALFEHLESPEATALIVEANQPGRSSAEVQNVFLEHARQLGFKYESKGATFFEAQNYTNVRGLFLFGY